MAAMMLMVIHFNKTQSHFMFIIIAAILWWLPLISQLFYQGF